jgi:hypothetical protein
MHRCVVKVDTTKKQSDQKREKNTRVITGPTYFFVSFVSFDPPNFKADSDR